MSGSDDVKDATVRQRKRGRVNFILTVTMLALLAALGGVFVFARYAAGRKKAAEFRAVSSVADGLYQQEKFAEAMSAYQKLADDPRWAGDEALGAEARRGGLMCRGRMDLREGMAGKGSPAEIKAKLESAIAEFRAAEALGTAGSGAAAGFINDAAERRVFNEQAGGVADLLKDAEAPGDVEMRLAEMRPQTMYEQDVKNRLADELRARTERAADEETVAQAEKIRESRGAAAAIGFLQGEVADKPRDRVQAALLQLRRDVRFDELMKQAAAAEKAGRYREALKQLLDAQGCLDQAGLDAADDAKVKAALGRVKGQAALAQAIEFEQAGRLDPARHAYLEAQVSLPGDARVEAGLARIDRANQKADLLRSAEREAPWGNYPAAIEHLKKALELDPNDQSVALLLAKAETKQFVQTGNQLTDSGKFDEARQAADEAKRRSPEDADVKALDKRVAGGIEYKGHFDRGSEYFKAGKYDDAKKEFIAARAAVKTDEVERLIKETEYLPMLADARALVQKNPPEYVQAWAILQIVMKEHPTAEAGKLADEVKAHLPVKGDGQR